MGGVFSSDDSDNAENEQMLNKTTHRGGSNQRRGKNKNTTSKNKPKKSVSFSDITNENDDLDNDNDYNESSNNDNDNDNYNDNDIAEPIAKKRKTRKQSTNSTKKRRYN
jgi:hypothetical protein